MRVEKKRKLLQRRRRSIRKKVRGTVDRPRLSVRFTGRHIYVQFIDDEQGRTLAQTSTRSKQIEEADKLSANVAGATRIGKAAAEAAQQSGITGVVFDRSGARYHGKVAALADAAREAGLKF